MKALVGAVVSCLALAVSAWAAETPELPGPRFGKTTFEAEFLERSGEPDVDQYVARLMRGEFLSVRVSSGKGSGVHPTVSLIGPDGQTRPVAWKTRRAGRTVFVRGFFIDETGAWQIRVGDGARIDGTYTLTTSIRPPRRARTPREAVLAGGPPGEHTIEAVEGSTLALTLTSARKRDPVDLLTLRDPAGGDVPEGSGTAVESALRRGRKVRLLRQTLVEGDGEYVALVGTQADEAKYSLVWRVTPPERPRGRTTLGPGPHLDPVGEPIEAPVGAVLVLDGDGFLRADQLRCWFGTEEAAVLAVNARGDELTVVAPGPAEAQPVPVLIESADGQFIRRPAHFRYVEPRILDVVALTPVSRQVGVGVTARFRVFLSDPAPPGGTDVALSVEGAIGTVPPVAHVSAGATLVTFDLIAAADPASGRILASLVRVVSAEVELVPVDPGPDPDPDPGTATLDLSGWQLRQEDSDRTFTFPAGTEVAEGGYVVVGRGADRAAFETFWDVTLSESVVYFDGQGDFPTVNGDERYTLLDPSGAEVDGPTVRMPSLAGQLFQRVRGQPAGDGASWLSGTSVYANAHPGAGQTKQSEGIGIYVSEFSDAPGAGNYPHEFVELYFDGPLP